MVEFGIDNLENLPEGYIAKVFDPIENKYKICNDSIFSTLDLKGMGEASAFVVVGTQDYFKYVEKYLTVYRYFVLDWLRYIRTHLNGLAKLHYTLPNDIQSVQFTLYNLTGRRLWESVQSSDVNEGNHIFYLDGKKLYNGKGALPAGVYILRLHAVNKAGKKVFGGERVITCIK